MGLINRMALRLSWQVLLRRRRRWQQRCQMQGMQRATGLPAPYHYLGSLFHRSRRRSSLAVRVRFVQVPMEDPQIQLQ